MNSLYRPFQIYFRSMLSYLIFKLHAVCNEYSWVLKIGAPWISFKMKVNRRQVKIVPFNPNHQHEIEIPQ